MTDSISEETEATESEARQLVPMSDELRDTVERLESLPDDLRSAIGKVIDAAETVDSSLPSSGDLSLLAIVHQVFQDSVSEFFTSEASSTLLPPEFRDRLASLPGGLSLPDPASELDIDLADALDSRRSERSFSNEAISLEVMSTWLFHSLGRRDTEAGYGVAGMPLFRFPTIGGLCGLEFDLLVNRVDGLERGRYRYDPVGHALVLIDEGDYRPLLVSSTFESDWIAHAPVVVACVVHQARTSWKYKTRSYRFAHVDLGAAVQNIVVVASALGLLSCPVAAFFDEAINEALQIPLPDKYMGLLVALGGSPKMGVGS